MVFFYIIFNFFLSLLRTLSAAIYRWGPRSPKCGSTDVSIFLVSYVTDFLQGFTDSSLVIQCVLSLATYWLLTVFDCSFKNIFISFQLCLGSFHPNFTDECQEVRNTRLQLHREFCQFIFNLLIILTIYVFIITLCYSSCCSSSIEMWDVLTLASNCLLTLVDNALWRIFSSYF